MEYARRIGDFSSRESSRIVQPTRLNEVHCPSDRTVQGHHGKCVDERGMRSSALFRSSDVVLVNTFEGCFRARLAADGAQQEPAISHQRGRDGTQSSKVPKPPRLRAIFPPHDVGCEKPSSIPNPSPFLRGSPGYFSKCLLKKSAEPSGNLRQTIVGFIVSMSRPQALLDCRRPPSAS